MLSTIGKTVIAGAVTALGLGFSVNQAAADSFSVSVHTPGVSAGYSNHRGHDYGYVDVYAPPAPVYAPRPVVVAPPPVVVVEPRHVCSWDRVPVTRVRYDDCGRRIYYTEYVKVRSCDDWHYRHDHGHGHYVKYDTHHHYKHGNVHHKYDDHHKHGKHGKHHDDAYRYSRNWDDDDRHDRHDNHRGRGHR